MRVKAHYDIFNHIRGLWAGHAMLAAHELGVLDLLWRSSLSTDQICEKLSLDARGTVALLGTLRDIGIVETKDHVNTLTPSGCEAADPDGSLSGYLAFHSLLKHTWAELPDRLKQRFSGTIEPNRSDSPEVVKAYIKAMDALGQPVADELARALDVRPGEKVLDLGGGSSIHARAILARQPEAHVMLLDRPVVIRLLRQSLFCKSNAPEHLTLVEGNYLDFKENEQFDLVLLANVIHNEGPEDLARILQSCSSALRPGGRLAILDYLADSHQHTPACPTGFDILVYLITSHGSLYTRSALVRIETNAGFGTPDFIQLGPYSLVISKKDRGGV